MSAVCPSLYGLWGRGVPPLLPGERHELGGRQSLGRGSSDFTDNIELRHPPWARDDLLAFRGRLMHFPLFFVMRYVPETKGQSLEALEKSLRDGSFLPASRN